MGLGSVERQTRTTYGPRELSQLRKMCQNHDLGLLCRFRISSKLRRNLYNEMKYALAAGGRLMLNGLAIPPSELWRPDVKKEDFSQAAFVHWLVSYRVRADGEFFFCFF